MSLTCHNHTACETPTGAIAHSHAQADVRLKTLGIVWGLTLVYFVIEAIGAWLSGSLTLLADSFHMFADVSAVSMALLAAWFAKRPPSDQKTYGYHRLEILVAFSNGLLLVAMAMWIFFEAVKRFQHPHPVHSGLMLWVAVGGLVINCVSAWLLHRNAQDNINMRGALLHVLSDLMGSVSAVTCAILIGMWGNQWQWLDAVFSGVLAVLILSSAWRLVWEAAHVLLEHSPAHINVASVKAAMLAFPGVLSVHHLHVWSITSGKDILAAHVVMEPHALQTCYSGTCDDDGVESPMAMTLANLQNQLQARFGFAHLTLQLEPPGFAEEEPQF